VNEYLSVSTSSLNKSQLFGGNDNGRLESEAQAS